MPGRPYCHVIYPDGKTLFIGEATLTPTAIAEYLHERERPDMLGVRHIGDVPCIVRLEAPHSYGLNPLANAVPYLFVSAAYNVFYGPVLYGYDPDAPHTTGELQ